MLNILGAGKGDPEVIILDSSGSKTTAPVFLRPRQNDDVVEPQYQQQSTNDLQLRRGSKANGSTPFSGTANGSATSNGNSYGGDDDCEVTRAEYTATTLGLHSVNVFFAGKPIPGSPFGVKVGPGKYGYTAAFL